jgi:hypothetical protein
VGVAARAVRDQALAAAPKHGQFDGLSTEEGSDQRR